jgi:hypothetical protein
MAGELKYVSGHMSEAQRRLRAVPLAGARSAPDREIAVRFSSSSGLIARLHRPSNSFNWVGTATLRFGSQGVLITAKRATWLGLRQTQRLITRAEINDVCREGNAVRVHLRGPRQTHFRLWAEDSASAAQIVALLPTQHTIEFDSAIREPESVLAWRGPAVGLAVLLVVACLGGLIWVAEHRALNQHEAKPRPFPQSPPPAARPKNPKLQTDVTPEDMLLAAQDLRVFGDRIEVLSTEFQVAWDALQEGKVSQTKFADELDQWLRPQWDTLEARVRETIAAPDSARARADHELIAVINNWQLALYAYVDDLRNHRQVVKSFEYFRNAHRHLQRAWQMQSQLDASATHAE